MMVVSALYSRPNPCLERPTVFRIGHKLVTNYLLTSSLVPKLILHRHMGFLSITHSSVCQWQCEILPSAETFAPIDDSYYVA